MRSKLSIRFTNRDITLLKNQGRPWLLLIQMWLPTGVYTTYAERTLNKDNEWAAPILWRSEFRNILAGYIRRKNLTIDMAIQLIEHAEKQMKSREYIALLNLVAL